MKVLAGLGSVGLLWDVGSEMQTVTFSLSNLTSNSSSYCRASCREWEGTRSQKAATEIMSAHITDEERPLKKWMMPHYHVSLLGNAQMLGPAKQKQKETHGIVINLTEYYEWGPDILIDLLSVSCGSEYDLN